MSSYVRQLFGVQRVAFCGMVLLAVLFSGCAAPRVQSRAPGMASFLVGPRACPRCGLLPEQGCCCQPDMWNHGYHPTVWRPLLAGAQEDRQLEDVQEVHEVPPSAPEPSDMPPEPPAVAPPAETVPPVSPAEHDSGPAADQDQQSRETNKPAPKPSAQGTVSDE